MLCSVAYVSILSIAVAVCVSYVSEVVRIGVKRPPKPPINRKIMNPVDNNWRRSTVCVSVCASDIVERRRDVVGVVSGERNSRIRESNHTNPTAEMMAVGTDRCPANRASSSERINSTLA